MHCPTLASACRVIMWNQSPRTRIECIGCSVSTISVGANTIPCAPDIRAGGDDDINPIREPCISNEVSANWLLISGQTVHNFMKRPKSFGVVREAATVRALTSQYGATALGVAATNGEAVLLNYVCVRSHIRSRLHRQ